METMAKGGACGSYGAIVSILELLRRLHLYRSEYCRGIEWTCRRSARSSGQQDRSAYSSMLWE